MRNRNFGHLWMQALYSNQVLQNYEAGSRAGMKPIQFPMSQMKPLGAHWLIELHQHMLTCPDAIKMVSKLQV